MTIEKRVDEHAAPQPIDPAAPEMFGHPKGLFYLFFAELWERFSFYGMRALLVLYMVKNLFVDNSDRDTIAFGIYAAYGALVYATPVIGGMIADKLIGFRRAIMLGAALMALGHFALAIEHPVFFYGSLALLIVGNGFFKPNISTLVGTLYREGDPRRDAGFTIFYMGINLGAMVAPLVCGWLGLKYGWHWGFGAAGVGMLVGLVFFWYGARTGVFGNRGLAPDPEAVRAKVAGISKGAWVVILSLLTLPFFALLVFHGEMTLPGGGTLNFTGELIGYAINYVLLPVILFILIRTMIRSSKVERERLLVVVLLTFFITVFWSFFEQSGSSLTLFAERNVNLTLLNAAQTNSINPAFIVLFAIPFSAMWVWLSRLRMNPYTPIKYALGIAQLGLGFLVFAWSANFADANSQVPMVFLVVGYLLLTTGELFVSPVGLSKVTELAPKKILAFAMGVFFLSSSFAHHIAGIIAKLTSVAPVEAGGEISTAQSLITYTSVFSQIGYIALGFALLTLIMSPLMKKWMHGIH